MESSLPFLRNVPAPEPLENIHRFPGVDDVLELKYFWIYILTN